MKLPQRIELYANIQRELDEHRVDEWHSVIPLSKDGGRLLDDMCKVSNPERVDGVNGLRLHDTMQIQPHNAHTTMAYNNIFEDRDYIYSTFIVQSADRQIVQITRHDKENYLSWNKKEFAKFNEVRLRLKGNLNNRKEKDLNGM